jgi:hypothetical protein
MNPMLEAPVNMRSKVKYGKLLSSFAFKSNMRRYNMVCLHARAGAGAGAARLLRFVVGRCRLTLSDPC